MICPTHGGPELPRGVPCEKCIAERTPIQVESVDSEDIDRQLLKLADECIGHKRKLWNLAEKLLDDGSPQDHNTAAKLSAESAKWLRLAREIRGEVSQRDQLRKAIAHEKEMQGKRGGH